MKYRSILLRDGDNLVLNISELNSLDFDKSNRELITTQIFEDFMPRGYFSGKVKEIMPDAICSSTGSVLTLQWPFTQQTCESVISCLNTIASPYRYGRVAEDYTALIGKTPLLNISRLVKDCRATVLVKLESMEPNSVKDRTVYSILSQAVKRGDIDKDSEVIEASSGNVAIAIAAILKTMMNKKPKIFISKMHGPSKARSVRITGTPIILTGKEEGSLSAKKGSVKYAANHDNVFEVNQHSNPDNYRAHRLTTGPELYHQCYLLTGQEPAEFVTGLGSGGTAVGVALFRDDIKANFKVIGVEPAQASLWTGGTFHPHRFSGIASGWMTDIIKEHRDKIDSIETFTWQEGFEICRQMLIEEGLFVGPSTGASIGTAIRRAKLPENEGKVIVTIAHDRGERYMNIEDLFVPPPEATEEDME